MKACLLVFDNIYTNIYVGWNWQARCFVRRLCRPWSNLVCVLSTNDGDNSKSDTVRSKQVAWTSGYRQVMDWYC